MLLLGLALFARRRGDVFDDLGDGWVWPLPELDPTSAQFAGVHRRPVISDEYGSGRDGGSRLHAGVDVMYERVSKLPKGTKVTDGGSRGFYVPPGTPALAAHDGKVWSAGRGKTGWFVILDHGPLPFATYYTHLTKLFIPAAGKGNRNTFTVAAGQPLGDVGASPLDAEHVVHLHFEVRRGKSPGDPRPAMLKNWGFVR